MARAVPDTADQGNQAESYYEGRVIGRASFQSCRDCRGKKCSHDGRPSNLASVRPREVGEDGREKGKLGEREVSGQIIEAARRAQENLVTSDFG
jgi:hypothetical protein